MAQHDLIVENGNGATVMLDMQNALQALATCSAGASPPATTYPGQFWLDLSVGGNGYLRMRSLDNLSWVEVAGMPSKASALEAGAGTDAAKYLSPAGLKARQTAAWGAARNRIVNGAMQISQETGGAGTGLVSNGSNYPADQWMVLYGVSPGQVSISRRNDVVTPNGGRYVLNCVCNTVKASLAAADYWYINHIIEGGRVADLQWGTPNAKPIIVRFWMLCNTPGTYTVSLKNVNNTRTYLHSFVLAPNYMAKVEFVVPGDTTGTWDKGTGAGLQFAITLAMGSNYVSSTLDAWQAGNFFAAPAQANGMSAIGSYFIGDVGIYADLNGSGTPPRWRFPDEAQELLLCQRYWAQAPLWWAGNGIGGATMYGCAQWPVDMRVIPGVSEVNIANTAGFGTTTTLTTRSARAVIGYRTHTGTATGAYFAGTIVGNARM